MAVNRIETKNGTILLDLSTDSITADKLVAGITAHDKSGALITGTMTGSVEEWDGSIEVV